MKNYVINLAHSSDRRENVKLELQKIDLEPNFFPAVYGKELTEEEIKTRVLNNSFLSLGEIGCALSHLNIYQDMIENKIPYAVIFEDDIEIMSQLTVDIFNQLAFFVQNYPQNKPLVLSLHNPTHRGKATVNINHQISINKTISEMCAHAYFINLSGAKNLLDVQTPLKFDLDMWRYYVYLGAIAFYTSSVSLVKQKKYPSEIWQQAKQDKFFTRERKKLKNAVFAACMKQRPLKIKLKAFYLRILKFLFY